jgi:hypothetical protein
VTVSVTVTVTHLKVSHDHAAFKNLLARLALPSRCWDPAWRNQDKGARRSPQPRGSSPPRDEAAAELSRRGCPRASVQCPHSLLIRGDVWRTRPTDQRQAPPAAGSTLRPELRCLSRRDPGSRGELVGVKVRRAMRHVFSGSTKSLAPFRTARDEAAPYVTGLQHSARLIL